MPQWGGCGGPWGREEGCGCEGRVPGWGAHMDTRIHRGHRGAPCRGLGEPWPFALSPVLSCLRAFVPTPPFSLNALPSSLLLLLVLREELLLASRSLTVALSSLGTEESRNE